MTYLIVKFAASAALVMAVSELSKQSTLWGGFLASLLLTTFLALIWLYVDTRSVEKAAGLSMSVFWLVLPSLVFFPVLSVLLIKARWPFASAIAASTVSMFGAYVLMIVLLRRVGVSV